jgi:hypothetical protein
MAMDFGEKKKKKKKRAAQRAQEIESTVAGARNGSRLTSAAP